MYTTSFEELPLRDLLARVQTLRHDGVRFVQLCAEMGADDAINLLYTFYDEAAEAAMNLVVPLADGDEVPSIQGLYFAAFSYENETHDLFGVKFANMELDFGGHFFNLAAEAPMTIISPEQKAAREKAAKMKAAALKKAEAAAAKKALEQSAAKADAEAVARIRPDAAPSAAASSRAERPKGRGVEGFRQPGGDPSTPGASAPSAQDDMQVDVIPSEAPPVIPSEAEGSRQPEGDPSTPRLRRFARDDKHVDVIPSGDREAVGVEGSHSFPIGVAACKEAE